MIGTDRRIEVIHMLLLVFSKEFCVDIVCLFRFLIRLGRCWSRPRRNFASWWTRRKAGACYILWPSLSAPYSRKVSCTCSVCFKPRITLTKRVLQSPPSPVLLWWPQLLIPLQCRKTHSRQVGLSKVRTKTIEYIYCSLTQMCERVTSFHFGYFRPNLAICGRGNRLLQKI